MMLFEEQLFQTYPNICELTVLFFLIANGGLWIAARQTCTLQFSTGWVLGKREDWQRVLYPDQGDIKLHNSVCPTLWVGGHLLFSNFLEVKWRLIGDCGVMLGFGSVWFDCFATGDSGLPCFVCSLAVATGVLICFSALGCYAYQYITTGFLFRYCRQ